MARITYFTRSARKGQPVTVYMRYVESRDCNHQVKTPEKVFPEYWTGEDGRWFKKNAVYTPTFSEEDKVNMVGRLYGLKQYIASQRLLLKSVVERKWVEEQVNRYYDRSLGREGLNEYLKRFITEMETGVRLNGGMRFTFGTIDTYRALQTAMDEYQGIYSEKREKRRDKLNIQKRKLKIISFPDITTDFVSEFKKYWLELGNRPNYVSSLVSRLKTVVETAYDEGVHTNEEFRREAFKTKIHDVDNIYLTEEEIRRIYDLKIEDEQLDQIRDVFLAGCYTAQRFSDYSIFKSVNIKTISSKKVLDFTQRKTGARCVIPLRPELEKILVKYDYNLPRVSYFILSRKIRNVCEMAKIDEDIAYTDFKGGFKVKKTVKKWEKITTHTARRSGATNMILAGVSLHSVMKIGGWKTESSMMKYLKMSEIETATSLLNQTFFIGSPLSVAK